MKIFLCLWLTSVSFTITVGAQPVTDPDSLIQYLRKGGISDGARAKTYMRLGYYHLDGQLPVALQYADSALAMVGQAPHLLSQMLLLKSSALRHQGLSNESLTYGTQALEAAVKEGNKKMEGDAYRELATLSEITSDLVKALEFNQKALDIFVATKDTFGIAEVYNSIGIIYWNKQEHQKALEYYHRAVAINDAAGWTLTNARLINNIGLIFQERNQFDSALAYYDQALSYLDQDKNKFGFALINNNVGICYRDTKQFNKALFHFNLTRKLQTEMNDQYGLALVNDNIARTFMLQDRYAEALPYLKDGLKNAQQTNNFDLLEDVTRHTAEVYERLGDYRNAFLFQQQAKVYGDSLQAKSLSQEIADLEVKYQVKQQQAENNLLKAENELNSISLRNQNQIIVGTVVFSVLVLILLVMAYRSLQSKRRAAEVIEEKNKRLEALYAEVEAQRNSIEEQKDEIASQNEELSVKNQYLEELNREKNSLMGIVAHDLKSPFNSIGGITNILPKLGPLNDAQKEFVDVINHVVDSSRVLIQDIMDLSAIENKEMKVHVGDVSMKALLNDLLNTYAAQAQQKGISIEIVDRTKDRFAFQSDGRHIERILQNLISNALKFSDKGTRVEIGARQVSNQVEFFVRDQGPGISEEDQKYLFRKFQKLTARPTGGESSSGLGLSIVKALIEELGGTIRVESELGKGTKFTCSLPVR